MIHRPELIDCLDEMVSLWQGLARKEGLSGIYFIGSNIHCESYKCLDAMYYHEPSYVFGNIVPELKHKMTLFDYDTAWQYILSEPIQDKVYFSGVVAFDDTPRRGEQARILKNSSPKKFEHYFSQLLKKSELCGNEYVFLNAWNEWGEGMYLELDTKYGTEYLQGVSSALSEYKNVEFVQPDKRDFEIKKKDYEIDRLKFQLTRYKSFWSVFDKWLCLMENDISLADYFIKHCMTKIALYGLGMLARHLIAQLKDTDVKIVYGIDQRCDSRDYEFPVYSPDEKLPPADAIIVSTVYDFDSVEDALSENINMKIVSLEDIVASNKMV